MIFLDTNVVSESMRKAPDPSVVAWLIRNEPLLALPTVTVAEIAYGIHRLGPGQRSSLLSGALDEWRRRLGDRIFSLTEEAAIAYGQIMGRAARTGNMLSAPDGMIAAIASVNGGTVATRNLADFRKTGVPTVSPWEAAV